MATPNLSLELIQSTDTIRDSLLNKMNENFTKLDEAYKVLVDALLERTKKSTLIEAIESIATLYNTEDATITAEDIKYGKIAYGVEGKIEGAKIPYNGPRVTIKWNASSSYIQNYGWAFNDVGTLVVYVQGNNTDYENISFNVDNIYIGTQGLGFGLGAGNGAGSAFSLFAFTIDDLSGYENIEVILNYEGINSSYDAVVLGVTVQEGNT